MANEFVVRNGLLALDNSVISGSLTVTGGITGSFSGTGSYAAFALSSSNSLTSSFAFQAANASNAVSASFATVAANASSASFATNASTAASASFATSAANATTASHALNAVTSSFATFASTAASASFASNTATAASASFATNASTAASASFATNAASATTASHALNAVTASHALNAVTASHALNAVTASYIQLAASASNALSASYALNASNATSASYSNFAISSSFASNAANASTASFAAFASTASNAQTLAPGTTVSASNIYVNNNLFVAGTASFGYLQTVTGSAVIIGEQFIILNADSPISRYAGIQIYDTGSASTASFEWDGVRDNWIIVEETGLSAGILTGPTGSKGSEVFPTTNAILKGTGHHTVGNSNISDNGSIVSVNSNTQITGSLIVSSGVTANLTGTSSFATTASYAGAASNATSASFATSAANATTASHAVNAVTASRALNANTASYATFAATATSASFAPSLETLATVAARGATANNAIVITPTGKTLQLGNAASEGGAGVLFAGSLANKNWFIGNQYNVNAGLEFTPTAAGGSTTIGTTPSMVINEGGSVGIGTTSPAYKLDVNGPLRVNDAIYFQGTLIDEAANEPSYTWLRVQPSSGDKAGVLQIGPSGTNKTGVIELYPSSSFNTALRHVIANSGSNATLRIGSDASALPIQFISSNSPTVTILSGGSVGIGTTSPPGKLAVETDTFKRAIFINSTSSTITDFTAGGTGIAFSRATDGSNNLHAIFAYESSTTHNFALATRGNLVFAAGGSSTYTSAPERMRITDGGNVGIGSTTPAYKLDVNGGAADTTIAAQNTGQNAVRLRLTNEERDFIITNSPADDLLSFFYGGVNRLQFNTTNQWFNSGNVGIGTTAPSSQVHINSGGSYTNTDANNRLFIERDSHAYILYSSPDERDQGLHFHNTTDNAIVGRIAYFHRTAGDSINLSVASSIRMTVYADGNVGIGTTTPSEKLHTIGNVKIEQTSNTNAVLTLNPNSGTLGTGYQWNLVGVNSGGNYAFQIREASSTYLTITNSAGGTGGSIGIGTTAPLARLHTYVGTSTVASASNAIGIFESSVNGVVQINGPDANSMGLFFGRTGAAYYSGIERAGTDLYLKNNSSVAVTINSGGSVGIGTTNPGNKLSVIGSAAVVTGNLLLTQGYGITWNNGDNYIQGISGYHLQFTTYDGSSQTEVMRLTGGSSGGARVGIGTTNPAYKLDVAGEARITGSVIGNQNSIIGGAFGTTTLANIPSATGATIGTYLNTFAFIDLATQAANGSWIDFSSGSGDDYQGRIRYNNSLQSMYFYTNASSTPLVSYTSTNVGIGTTSPSYKLHVAGDVFSTGTIQTDGNIYISYNGGRLYFDRPNGATVGAVGWNTDDNFYVGGHPDYGPGAGNDVIVRGFGANLILGTASTNYVWLNSSGNVGIGTTAPTRKLHIGSGAGSSPWMLLQGSFTTPAIDHSRIYFNDYNFGIGAGKWSSGEASNDDDLYLWSYNGTGRDIRFAVTTDGSTAVTSSNWTTNMIIKNNGSIGIGTTLPSYKTEVAGAVGQYWNGTAFTSTPLALAISNTNAGGYDPVLILQQADSAGTVKNAGGIGLVGTAAWTAGDNASQVSDMYFLVKNNSGGISERMRIKSNGNIGIGTTSPIAKLDVRGGSDGDAMISMGSNSVSGILNSQANIYINADSDNDSSSGVIGFGFNRTGFTGGTETMRILENGNVGIGTTLPSFKLQVDHGTTTQYVASFRNTADNLQLKIGTTTGALLNIQGSTISANAAYNIALQADGGNVGIGIPNPSSLLHTYTTTAADNAGHIQYENGNTGVGALANAQLIGKSRYGTAQLMVWENYGIRFGMRSTANGGAGDIYFTTGTDSVQMVIRGSNVGIGTTTADSMLRVQGTSRITGQFVQGSGDARATSGTTIALTRNTAFSANSDIGDGERFLSIVNESSTSTAFSNVCFRINPNSGGSSGNAMLDMKFVNNGSLTSTLYWTFNHGGSFGDKLTLTSAGTLTAAGDVVAYSDARLKENIITIDNAVEKVTAMRGVFFNKKEDETKSRRSGVIAQEIQEILPEVVTTSADGTLGVAYGNIVGVLIEAIKEQQKQIDELKYLLQTQNK